MSRTGASRVSSLGRWGRRAVRAARQVVEAALDPPERGLHLLVAVLRLGAAAEDEERGQDHEGEELQELALPVLEGRFAPGPDVAVVAEDVGGLLVLPLVGVELAPAG